MTTDIRRARASSARRILESTRPLRGSRVVDVGAGDGTVLLAFADASLRVGVDVDAALLERARKQSEGVAPPCIVLADAAALPFTDRSFDVALLYDVLEHVGSYERMVAEVNRVLAQGGVALVTAANRWSPITLLDDPHAHLPLLVALPPRVAEFLVHGCLRRPRRVMGVYPHPPSWRTLHSAFERHGIRLHLESNLRKLEDPEEILTPSHRALGYALRRLGLTSLLRSRAGRWLLWSYDRYLARSWTFVGVKDS